MKRHDSMRGWFAYELYQQMKKNKDIILLTGDLGYGMFDTIRDEMPDQFINTGASEQALIGIAVGLALEGKIPFCYSITPFLLYRPFETIKLYVAGENIPVKLIGSGRDKDYHIDGASHDASEIYDLFDNSDCCNENTAIFKNINTHFPQNKAQLPKIVDKMCKSGKPEFLSLRR